MIIAATLLFGSRARADHSEGSDTDLLMINLNEEMRHVSVGHLSLYLYPWHQLEQEARNGDLFVCHLVREAKPLLDPNSYLPKLRNAFEYRLTYVDEISRATDLGWYLVRFGAKLKPSLQARRALWCIRTILIARSAERRDPVFAPQRLAVQTQSAAGRILLSNRHSRYEDAAVRRLLRQFLEAEVASDYFLLHAGREAFLERFAATSNKVALQTFQQEGKGQSSYVG